MEGRRHGCLTSKVARIISGGVVIGGDAPMVFHGLHVQRPATTHSGGTPVHHRSVGEETAFTNGCDGLTQSLWWGVILDLWHVKARHITRDS